MKDQERFKFPFKDKIKFSLRLRLTFLVGAIVLLSSGISIGLVYLLYSLFPSIATLSNAFWLMLAISFIIGLICAYFLSKIFFDPIQKLRDGMKKVASGDFSVRLDEKASFAEMQDLFVGFNIMAQELSSTEIIQSDFVANASHEFKTPINAIEGYTTLLQGTENIDEIENEYIEKILFNTRRLSTLVSNVLLLSKIENQQIATNPAKYDLSEQIRECVLALEQLWGPKNIDFDVELDEILYFGNENMMNHVWTNLISNAIKFSPDGGQISLRLFKEANKIVFTVTDQGPGIKEETQKHLFDKFYQEDSSHKTEGNGLGLALVKRILLLSNGDVEVKNVERGGCKFTVTLNL